MSLDIGKLKNLARREDGAIIAQCPACAAEGCDRTAMNHLIIYPNGGYGCIKYPREEDWDGTSGRKQHLKEIFKLVGIPDPDDMGGVGDVGGQIRFPRPRYVGRKAVMCSR